MTQNMSNRSLFPLLDTLIAVYETGQFTVAAAELKVSQSTVSTRIASLEAIVGAELFHRHTKGDVTPTQAGTLLYQTATGMHQCWNETLDQVRVTLAQREPFTMVCSHTASVVLVPQIVKAVSQWLNSCDISIRQDNSEHILEDVSLKRAQLGIIEKPMVSESVRRVAICEDELVLAGDPSDTWLLREQGSGVRYYTDLYLRQYVNHTYDSLTLASNAAIMAALASGAGCSIVSRAACPEGVPIQRLGAEFIRRFYALIPSSGLSKTQYGVVDSVLQMLQDKVSVA